MRSAGEETERLVQLSEDVLVVARADGGGLPVRQGPIDLGQALSELSWRFTPRFAAADRELSVEVEEGNGVSADRTRLEQAIGSLLENALRHGAGRVRLWTAHDGQWIRIHVSDEGTGFPADFLPLRSSVSPAPTRAARKGGRAWGSRSSTRSPAHGGSAHAGYRAGGGADVWLVLPLDRGRLEPLAVWPSDASGELTHGVLFVVRDHMPAHAARAVREMGVVQPRP